MKKVLLSALAISSLIFTSCSDDDDNPKDPTVDPIKIETPASYTFLGKDGKSNVSFSGQVTRLKMAAQLKSALGTNDKTLEELNKMFAKGTGFADGIDNPKKALRGTIASGTYSTVGTAEAEDLRTKMDGWIKDFSESVVKNWEKDASKGMAGKLAYQKDGKTKYRYISAKGLEYNQAVAKTFIGAVIIDQIANKYVSKSFIDAAKADNDAGKVYKEGTTYTKLQHGWDEAYGYVFGLEDNPATPKNSTSKADRKGFLNSYLKSVDADTDFKGTFNNVYNAFKLGRAAIDAKQYVIVHKQAEIIRKEISKVIAVRAVHYLQKGKGTRDASKLHALSEAYGFVHSLRFVHISNTQAPKSSIDAALKVFDKTNGLWDVTDKELDDLSKRISGYFGFTVDQAL